MYTVTQYDCLQKKGELINNAKSNQWLAFKIAVRKRGSNMGNIFEPFQINYA